jgi:hypothetical protein
MIQLINSIFPLQPVHQTAKIRVPDGLDCETPKIHVCNPNDPTAWEKKYGYKNPFRTSCHHLGVTELDAYTEYLNKIGADEALDQLLRAGGERY